ncbi:MAG: DUF5050 domain-containing protein [Erysipelotrichaceae bacterium]
MKTYDPEPSSYVSYLSGGNLNNGSRFVQLDGWIYYSVCVIVDGVSSEYADNGFYRMSTDGTKTQKISKNCTNSLYTDGTDIYLDGSKLIVSTQKMVDYGIDQANPYKPLIIVNDTYIYIDRSNSNVVIRKFDGSKSSILVNYPVYDIAFKDGWVYYMTEYPVDCLRRVRYNGAKDMLVSKGVADNFLIEGNAIYYPSPTDGSKLYRMDLDGKNVTKLTDFKVTSLNSDGLRIYYINPESKLIRSVKLDGTDDKALSSRKAKDITIFNGWLYYNDQSILSQKYRISLTSGKEGSVYSMKEVSPDPSGANIVAGTYASGTFAQVGDWIYYGLGAGIYKVHPDGTSKTKISSIHGISICIVGNYIYFVNPERFYTIYRMNLDGTDPRLVKATPSGSFYIKDGWIYGNGYEGYGMYKMKVDGTEIKGFDGFNSITTIVGDMIYGSHCGEVCVGLFKIKLDGTGLFDYKVGENYIDSVNVVEDWIYYIDNPISNGSTNTPVSKLIKINISGTESIVVNDKVDSNYRLYGIYEGWMYLKGTSATEALVRMSMDGSQRQVVIPKNSSSQASISRVIFLGDKLITDSYVNEIHQFHISNLDGSNRVLFLK